MSRVGEYAASRSLIRLKSAQFPARRPLCLMLSLALPATTGSAANYIVTSSSDSVSDSYGNTSDTTTLRYALIQANAVGGTNSIVFSSAVNSPITLAAPLPLVLNNLTIDGSGAQNGAVTLDGGNQSGLGHRLLFVGIDEATRTNVIARISLQAPSRAVLT